MKRSTAIKTFLIIDGDRVFSNAVRDCLSGDSVKFLIANSAADGIDFCPQKMINVVLPGKRRKSSLHSYSCPDPSIYPGNPFATKDLGPSIL
jgi:hypothetical protein